MSKFFERYEDAMPMNPAVMRLTKLVVLMSFAAHLAVRFKLTLNAFGAAKGLSAISHRRRPPPSIPPPTTITTTTLYYFFSLFLGNDFIFIYCVCQACVWYAVGAQSISKGRNSWIEDYCVNDGVYNTCLDERGLAAR